MQRSEKTFHAFRILSRNTYQTLLYTYPYASELLKVFATFFNNAFLQVIFMMMTIHKNEFLGMYIIELLLQ